MDRPAPISTRDLFPIFPHDPAEFRFPVISIEIEVKNWKVKFQEYFLSDGFPFRLHTRFDNTILNPYFRKIFNEDFKLDRQDSKHKPPTLKFQFFLRRTHSKRASCLLLPPVLPTRASYHRSSKSLHDREISIWITSPPPSPCLNEFTEINVIGKSAK